MNQQSSRLYFPALTGLRFVAASMIYALHNTHGLPEWSPEILVHLIRELHGSTIFFVLSGFLIANSVQAQGLTRISEYGKFIFLRLIRIYPLYLLVFTGLHLQWLFFIPELILHVSLLKGYFSKTSLAGIAQTWSLTVEVTFYLFAPILFRLIQAKSILLTYVVTLLIGVVLTLLGMLLKKYDLNPFGFMPNFYFTMLLTFFGRATDFFPGIYLSFQLKLPREKGVKWLSWPISYTYTGIILFFLIIYLISTFGDSQQVGITNWYGLLINNLILPWSIILVIYGLIKEKTFLNKILSSNPFSLLGKASYAFFLIHMGWINNFIQLSVSDNIFIVFLIHWALAIFLYYIFDKPLYYWFKLKLTKR